MKKTVTIGIDLGTTNTLVCMERKGKPKCLKFYNIGKDIILPSVVGVSDGKVFVGTGAESLEVTDPESVVRSAKSYMNDIKKNWTLCGKTYSPVDISTEILKAVREVAVDNAVKNDKSVSREDIEVEAVITVPAYFKNLETNLTKKAGENAGIKVKRIITEPMAAALTYINDNDVGSEKKLLVIDLGGGTFDLSLLSYDEETKKYQTGKLGGERRLGGDDFDSLVLKELVNYACGDFGIDLTSEKTSGLDALTWRRMIAKLRSEAKTAKEYLSSHDEAHILIPGFYKGVDFETYISRDEFDDFCKGLYDRIEMKIINFLKESGITSEDIWRVVLVGGSCSIHYIQDMAKRLFTEDKIYYDSDMESPVAKGALLAASNLMEIPPDILSHSLGIQIQGGKFEPMLHRSQLYPCSATKLFTTTSDNQASVSVNIFETIDEGEDSSEVKNCSPYGFFELCDIQKAKKGEPQIEVTFSFDESRILTVSAIDKKTGSSAQIELKEAMTCDMPTVGSMPAMIYLLIDCSWSMSGGKLDKAKEASHQLVNNMIDFSRGTKMAIVEFKSTAKVVCSLTSDKTRLNGAICTLTEDGGTAFAEAIALAKHELTKLDSSAPKYIISLTDGAPDSVQKTINEASAAKRAGISLINIGVGLDSNAKKLLTAVSSVRDDQTSYVYLIDDMNGLAETFKTIVGELALHN